MQELDLSVLAQSLSRLTGLPVRILRKDKEPQFFSKSLFPFDPFMRDYSAQARMDQAEGYLSTYSEPSYFFYVGIKVKGQLLVIGPDRLSLPSDGDRLTFALSVSKSEKETKDLLLALKTLPSMPVDVLIESLSLIAYTVTGSKPSAELELSALTPPEPAASASEGKTPAQEETMFIERRIHDFIRGGNESGLKEFMSHIPFVQGGTLAPSLSRQAKNMFVVTATLASRAAIEGGLDIGQALSLSDTYISQSEAMLSQKDILSLQYQMLLDYARRVALLHSEGKMTKLVQDVENLLLIHLEDPLSIEEMAESLALSRATLERRFRQESGTTIEKERTRIRLSETKRLLRETNQDLETIRRQLGYGSLTAFSLRFKKETGISPSSYRKQNLRLL